MPSHKLNDKEVWIIIFKLIDKLHEWNKGSSLHTVLHNNYNGLLLLSKVTRQNYKRERKTGTVPGQTETSRLKKRKEKKSKCKTRKGESTTSKEKTQKYQNPGKKGANNVEGKTQKVSNPRKKGADNIEGKNSKSIKTQEKGSQQQRVAKNWTTRLKCASERVRVDGMGQLQYMFIYRSWL